MLAAEDGAIADFGNAGIALGGMGHLLYSIIGGWLAQKLSLYDAACAGYVVHSTTSERILAQLKPRQGTPS